MSIPLFADHLVYKEELKQDLHWRVDFLNDVALETMVQKTQNNDKDVTWEKELSSLIFILAGGTTNTLSFPSVHIECCHFIKRPLGTMLK